MCTLHLRLALAISLSHTRSLADCGMLSAIHYADKYASENSMCALSNTVFIACTAQTATACATCTRKTRAKKSKKQQKWQRQQRQQSASINCHGARMSSISL